jgi:Zn-dependent protease
VKTTKLIEPILTFVSAIVSTFAGVGSAGTTIGVAGVLALAFHEYGHFRAARKAGYNPPWFWFIPLLGAFLRSPHFRSKLHEAKVAYGGPFDGLVFTLAVFLLWGATLALRLPGRDFLFTLVTLSVALNLFNLVPIVPLDGGRMSLAMHGRWPERMQIVGFGLLIAITAWSKHATMLVVWILVVGELPAPRLRRSGDGKTGSAVSLAVRTWLARERMKLRYLVSLSLLSVIVAMVAFDLVVDELSFWVAFGEILYTIVGASITLEYRKEMRGTKTVAPREERRKHATTRAEGRAIFHVFLTTVIANIAIISTMLLVSILYRQ